VKSELGELLGGGGGPLPLGRLSGRERKFFLRSRSRSQVPEETASIVRTSRAQASGGLLLGRKSRVLPLLGLDCSWESDEGGGGSWGTKRGPGG